MIKIQNQNIKVTRYSIEPRFRILVKGYGFLFFAKNMGKNIAKNVSKYISVCNFQFMESPVEHGGTE